MSRAPPGSVQVVVEARKVMEPVKGGGVVSAVTVKVREGEERPAESLHTQAG